MGTKTPKGAAPCIAACAINQDARGYVQLIARGRFEEAFQLVRSRNTFPASCGRICTRRCETVCRRSSVDEPIAIAWLKRFLSDKDFTPRLNTSKTHHPERVAIVGAGPAGLTVANDLALHGYKCVIFEGHSEPGGMLRTGVPRYRLPTESLDTDINGVLSLGVELRTGTKLGTDFTLDSLFEDGFKAVFIGIGAHQSLKMEIPGENSPGVMRAIEFLREVSLGKPPAIGRRVAVVGGGETALDSARSALRIGAQAVTIVYRRSVDEMPCEETSRLEAEEEGLGFKFLSAPVEILSNDGMHTLKCIRMKLGEPDQSGRRRPIPVAGSEFVLDVDNVIMAIGQSPELAHLDDSGLHVTPRNTIGVKEDTLTTDRDGVFAGGDAIKVGGTLIEAIADGRRAAGAIHSYLRNKRPGTSERLTPMPELSSHRVGLVKKELRKSMPVRAVGTRIQDFSEVEQGYADELAMMEARRCLNCGAGAEVDPERCVACLTCVRVCPYDVPELNRIDKKAAIGVDCQSCGICVVECPARAIVFRDRYEDQGRDSLENALSGFSGPEHGPNVIVFLSQYDPHSRRLVPGLDRQGGNVRTVQVSCIGKMDPILILRAIEEGADGVVVVACTPEECPYQTGDFWAKKRLEHVSRLLSEMGLEAQRLRWLSPSPEEEFFGMFEEMVAQLKGLGPVFKKGN